MKNLIFMKPDNKTIFHSEEGVVNFLAIGNIAKEEKQEALKKVLARLCEFWKENYPQLVFRKSEIFLDSTIRWLNERLNEEKITMDEINLTVVCSFATKSRSFWIDIGGTNNLYHYSKGNVLESLEGDAMENQPKVKGATEWTPKAFILVTKEAQKLFVEFLEHNKRNLANLVDSLGLPGEKEQ